MKILRIDPSICTGCRTCELACSMHHYKQFNPARSRVRVVRNLARGTDVPVGCQQCEDAVCMEVCPVHAMYRDPQTNAVLINYDICIGCKLCVWACPLAGLSIDLVTGKVIKCDLCGGEPECVKFCSVKAVDYVDVSDLNMEMKRRESKKLVEAIAVSTKRGE